ncbi:hypothetical protein B0I31_106497 [Saccharothrix carnea]|uniref:Uncharacterized protein n=1 Tax=Saccharothrix carnea TaxID=1280637 RepID=A0A2P8I952_SACCR|nr:hypothetical protein [Saccharothrix carnea]PSL54977.1 hypothetical protein B0I31_106497 [Saccharothrix carnea]
MTVFVSCTDRELLDALARVIDVLDPAPEAVAVRARSAFGERTGAACLRLLSDSVRVDPSGGPRRVAFTGLDLRLELVVGGWDVTGVARVGTVVGARWPGGGVTAAVDEVGRFRLGRVPSGPVWFVLRCAGREHATPWFVA